jgi:hypothetical protein
MFAIFLTLFLLFTFKCECSQKCREKSFNITLTNIEIDQNNITLFYSIKKSFQQDLDSSTDFEYAKKCLKSVVVQFRPANDLLTTNGQTIVENSFKGNLDSSISIANLTFLHLYYIELSYIQFVNDDLIVEMDKLTNLTLVTCFGQPSRPSNLNVISFSTNNTIFLSWNSSSTPNSPFVCYYEITIIDFENSNITILDLAGSEMKFRFDSISKNTTIYLSAVNDKTCYMNSSNLAGCKTDRLMSDYYTIVYTGSNITFGVSSVIISFSTISSLSSATTTIMSIPVDNSNLSSIDHTILMTTISSINYNQTSKINKSNRIISLNKTIQFFSIISFLVYYTLFFI